MIIVMLITMVNLLGFGLIFPLVPILEQYYNLTPATVSNIAGIFAIFMIVGSIVFGILSDRIGRKPVLWIPIFIGSFAYMGNAFSPNYEWFLFFRGLSGFASGSFAVTFAAAADLSTPESRVKNMSAIASVFGISFILGPIISGLLTSVTDDIHLQIRYPFILASIICFIAGCVCLLTFTETLSKNIIQTKTESIIKEFIHIYSHFNILFFTLLNIIYMSLYTGLQIYLGLWLFAKFQLKPQQIGTFWAIAACIMLVAQFVLRRFFTKSSTGLVILNSFVFFGLGLLVLSFAHTYAILAIAIILIYASMAFLQSMINASISLSGKASQQGMIFGINQSIAGIGRVIGPSSFGFLITTFHYDLTWNILAILCVVVSALSFLYLKNK